MKLKNSFRDPLEKVVIETLDNDFTMLAQGVTASKGDHKYLQAITSIMEYYLDSEEYEAWLNGYLEINT